MPLIDQVAELKKQGYTVAQIAKQINKPYWLIKVLYNRV